jgi:hypothetical protein
MLDQYFSKNCHEKALVLALEILISPIQSENENIFYISIEFWRFFLEFQLSSKI